MEKKAMWSLAAKNGLLLSTITIVAVSLATFLTLPSSISIILTIVKFAAIISVLYYFMKQYSEELEFVSYGDSFRYGLTICFLSSIICTTFTTLIMLYSETEVLELAIEQYMTMLESSGMGAEMDYDSIKSIMAIAVPIASFIGNMVFGLIYSSIIANFTKKDEVFHISEEE